MERDQATELIRALQTPAAFPHAVDRFQLIETHISWVILTGEFAYKFKKPVNFGFVDFTTLERRRFFCEEELRLNRRLAPDLYLDVVPVTGSRTKPQIGGAGTPIEYCVRMRQFEQDLLLDRLVATGHLSRGQIDALIRKVSEFHATIPAVEPNSPIGSPEQVADSILATFASLEGLEHRGASEMVAHLRRWCDAELERQRETFAARKREGFVRECHGDMHLGNMILDGENVTIFDCIEFNDELRWIDVVSEIAFCSMDLEHRGRPDFAHRFLNGCLESSGDYAGLCVLRIYQAYRALVRAKVARLRMKQATSDASVRESSEREMIAYLELAMKYSERKPPFLAITHGVSGSGKSYGAQELAEKVGAIRIRSDVERKRLMRKRAGSGERPLDDAALYSDAVTEETYSALAERSATSLKAGFSTIADATFLSRAMRLRFRDLAKECGVPFILLDFPEDVELCRSRIRSRQQLARDPSDANEEVLEHQLRAREPLLDDEKAFAVRFDTPESAISSIGRRMKAESPA